MKLSTLSEQFARVLQQRNILFPIVLMLGVSQVVLSVLLFWKEDRTVFVPPVLEKPFSIAGSAYSATYYEQMGLFLANLILTKSAATAPQQNAVLFKYVAPELVGAFQRDFAEEVTALQKENASYVFYPSEVSVNLGAHSVLLKGERHTYIGAARVEVAKEAYRLTFVPRGHLLYLHHFEQEARNE